MGVSRHPRPRIADKPRTTGSRWRPVATCYWSVGRLQQTPFAVRRSERPFASYKSLRPTNTFMCPLGIPARHQVPELSPPHLLISGPDADRGRGARRASRRIPHQLGGGRWYDCSTTSCRTVYRCGLRQIVSERLHFAVKTAVDHGLCAWRDPQVSWPPKLPKSTESRLNLSGVVYVSIFNPINYRKNWQDLLTGFLWALGDCEDATLVLKLITNQPRMVEDVQTFYRRAEHPASLSWCSSPTSSATSN